MDTTAAEYERYRGLIQKALGQHGLVADSWDEEDDRPTASLGQWRVVIAEDEDRGLYEGDEGELTATVVGAVEYGNLHVAFYFRNNDFHEGGETVTPFDEIEPV